jgi:transposase
MAKGTKIQGCDDTVNGEMVTDELWEHVQPLLPPPPQRRFRYPGRKPLGYRQVLTGTLFVLKTGIVWDDLPAKLRCGCGQTCRHYLRLWYQAGVWQRMHAVLLAELNGADQIDWERALIDASFARPRKGARTPARAPRIAAFEPEAPPPKRRGNK